jgi:hypothetical protein
MFAHSATPANSGGSPTRPTAAAPAASSTPGAASSASADILTNAASSTPFVTLPSAETVKSTALMMICQLVLLSNPSFSMAMVSNIIMFSSMVWESCGADLSVYPERRQSAYKTKWSKKKF